MNIWAEAGGLTADVRALLQRSGVVLREPRTDRVDRRETSSVGLTSLDRIESQSDFTFYISLFYYH